MIVNFYEIIYKIIIILIVFFKTGNLLSDNNLFNVNNILLEEKENTSSKQLANQAIKKAFKKLTERVLLKEDKPQNFKSKFFRNKRISSIL